MSEIIKSLRRIRRAKRLSQKEVARRAGVASGQISNWECGTYTPSLSNVEAWAQVLGYELELRFVLEKREEIVK